MVMNTQYYREFMRKCDIEVQKLRNFILSENAKGKTFNVYGASTKGNCTLQYANLGEREIPFAVERNPDKVGKMTCTGIPIIIEETMRESPPDYLLVLPWHFRTEIVAREKDFRDQGGKMVFPFPHFEVVGGEGGSE
jgi:NDP-4-keto-2,6-dideoxyhexose 3-C-methyltransferase